MTSANKNDPLYQLKENGNDLSYTPKAAVPRYELKFEKIARSFAELETVSKEMDQLAEDSTKNEKMGIQFRVIIDDTIIDITQELRVKPDNTLLDGETLKNYASQYLEYIKTIEELKGKDFQPQMVVHYYPLDIDNKTENISREDKNIAKVYYPSNNYEIINDEKKLPKIK